MDVSLDTLSADQNATLLKHQSQVAQRGQRAIMVSPMKPLVDADTLAEERLGLCKFSLPHQRASVGIPGINRIRILGAEHLPPRLPGLATQHFAFVKPFQAVNEQPGQRLLSGERGRVALAQYAASQRHRSLQ